MFDTGWAPGLTVPFSIVQLHNHLGVGSPVLAGPFQYNLPQRTDHWDFMYSILVFVHGGLFLLTIFEIFLQHRILLFPWSLWCILISFISSLLLTNGVLECLYNCFALYNFWRYGDVLSTTVVHSDFCRKSLEHSAGCKSGPKSRRSSRVGFLRLLICWSILGLLQRVSYWGEGCGLPMEITGVSPIVTYDLPTVDTKPHGKWPQGCPGTSSWRSPGSIVLKRSLTRAYKRAMACGFAWYKGRCLTIADFQHMRFAKEELLSADTHTQSRSMQVYSQTNSIQKPKGRVTCVSWNCGGLSQHKLDEVRLWSSVNHIPITMLQETHWGFSNTWSDDWHTIHSGVTGQRRAGLAVMIDKTFCTTAQLSWQEVIPGHLLHIRIQLPGRPLDLVCCYQHTCLRIQDNMRMREQWWNSLDCLLRNLPRRNLLLMAGDFNCSLPFLQTFTGTASFKWRSKSVPGPMHPDMGRFAEIVRFHGLAVLNTWDSTLGPSYINQDSGSRIDFAMTRLSCTDGESKRVAYLWTAPYLHCGSWGHVPILFSLRRHWGHGSRPHNLRGISHRQRLAARTALLDGSETWHVFIQQAQELIGQTQDQVQTSGTLDIEKIHNSLLPIFQQSFAHQHDAKSQPPWKHATHVICTKWKHRQELMAITDVTILGVFRAWFHWSRFMILSRSHRRQAKVLRVRKFQDLVQEATDAASRHDMFTLYRTINRYTPKHQQKRIQLRNSTGYLATPEESQKLLVDFVSHTWRGPANFDLRECTIPGVPFTVDALAAELSRIPISKAVAAPFLPGLVWKELAFVLAPLLHEQLTIWWNVYPPFIPQSWKDGWLCLLAKPLKPPTQPGNLRPIALQEPIGKAVVGLLTKVAMQQSLSQIIFWPLMAYLPGRSGLDCILRVTQHCKTVRDLVQSQRSGPHQRAQAVPRHPICGGAQIFLDLSRAFDMVSRTRLFQRLGQIGISPAVTCLLGHWHQNTHYHVAHDTGFTPVQIGRGVRQGCKGAPHLFNCFVVLLLNDLSQQLPVAWIRACLTVYADDFHVGCTYRSVQELEYMLTAFRLLFHTLSTVEMVVNPSKSVALLAMVGPASRKQKQRFVVRTQNGPALCLHADGLEDVYIPLQTQAKYLGTIMTYTSVEDATLQHRLAIARLNFSRLQPWLSKRHSLTIRQRVAIWKSCIIPIIMYGTLAVDISTKGLCLIQKTIINMLRKVARDHAFYSGHTHAQFLSRSGLPTPVQLLHGAIDSLLQSVTQRLLGAHDHDIVRTLKWNHLISLKLRVDALEAQDLFEGALPLTLQATTRPILCSLCDFQTFDVSTFRRHCTRVHHVGTLRTNSAKFSST